MKRYIIAAAAAFLITAQITAYAEQNIYRVDFSVYDNDRTYSAVLGGITVDVNGGMISVNNNAVRGMCGKNSEWYITSDETTGKFNIVLNGKSIFSGQTENTDTELVLSDCDNYQINSYGMIPYAKMTVSSDMYNISEKYITGIAQDTSADEIISNLKIDGNGTAKIITSNGIVESGNLKPGDSLICTDMLGETLEYTFPESDLGGMYSEFFNIDLTKMTVENLPFGLSDEQITGAIKSDKDFEAVLQNDSLVITANGNDYIFKNVVRPPETSAIYHSECDNNDFLNMSVSALDVSETYTDAAHGKALEIAPEQKGSNGTLKKAVEHDGKTIVISNDIKYNFEDPENHARQFNAPVIIGNSGDTFYVRERRGELVYRNPNDDYLMNVYSENDVWHNILMIIRPEEKAYSVYYDGIKKADGKLAQTFDSIKYLSYTSNVAGNAEGGKMYIDNISLFKPFVQLGTAEFGNAEKSSYNSENINGITYLKLIFSEADYNKINSETIASAINVTCKDNSIAFTAETNDNTVKLTFDTSLSSGEYKISIIHPETIYGEDGGTYEYKFNVGAKIKNVSAETDGKEVFAEVRLSENNVFDNENMVIGVYDFDMNLLGTNTTKIENTKEPVFLKCDIQNGIPYYVKFFVWDASNNIEPICGEYVKNLAEEAER